MRSTVDLVSDAWHRGEALRFFATKGSCVSGNAHVFFGGWEFTHLYRIGSMRGVFNYVPVTVITYIWQIFMIRSQKKSRYSQVFSDSANDEQIQINKMTFNLFPETQGPRRGAWKLNKKSVGWCWLKRPTLWFSIGAMNGRQVWCIFLLNEELKNLRILKILG